MAKASFGVSPVHPALPFTVDTFEPNHAGKPQFVTHAHKDHAVDIEQHATDIWCTETTRQLLLIRFPALARPRTTFHILAMPNPHGSDFEAEMDDHEPQQVMAADGTVFSVMAIPSQHCDGAAMLLFEGDFGRVLHSGDARLDERYLALVPPTALNPDLLYLDCTFGEAPLDFPARSEALRQAEVLIRRADPRSRVYISAETLGCEAVLLHISRRFGGAQMYLQPDVRTSFAWLGPGKQAERVKELDLLCPGLRTADPTATRFHICGSRELQNCLAKPRTEARRRGEPPPLFLRPSTQKWILTADEELETTGRRHGGLKGTACLRTPTAPFQENGVWYVLWSMHSSAAELKYALRHIQPCAAKPICGAMPAQLAGHCRLAEAEAGFAAAAAEAAARAASDAAAATAATAANAAAIPAAIEHPPAQQQAAAALAASASAPSQSAPAGRHSQQPAVQSCTSAPQQQLQRRQALGELHADRPACTPVAEAAAASAATTADMSRAPQHVQQNAADAQPEWQQEAAAAAAGTRPATAISAAPDHRDTEGHHCCTGSARHQQQAAIVAADGTAIDKAPSTAATQAADTHDSSRPAASNGSAREAGGGPAQDIGAACCSAKPCNSGGSPGAVARTAAPHGKENAQPRCRKLALPQKRPAAEAGCSPAEPQPTRKALAASPSNEQQQRRQQHGPQSVQPSWRQPPTLSSLDSTTMSDAFIDLDCLD